MSQTELFIARHGQTEYNRSSRLQGRSIDQSLNETGCRQARQIAQALKDENIQHIFCSSLKRSMETATIIEQKLNLPLHSFAELDEMNFGAIEGQPFHKIGDDIDGLQKNWRAGNTAFAVEGGESPDEVLKRALKRTDKLLKEFRGQKLLFVLHGRLIRILLAHWLGYGLANMHQIEHQNGALNHLQRNGNHQLTPVYLNKTDHLNTARNHE